MDIQIDLDRLIRAVEARRLQHDNPYARDLIRVLWPYGQKGLRRQYVMDRMWELRNPSGLPMPKAFENTVQSAFNQHNTDSLVFQKSKRGSEDAIFYPVGRKGSGVWAVRQDRAKAWLEARALGEV